MIHHAVYFAAALASTDTTKDELAEAERLAKTRDTDAALFERLKQQVIEGL